MASPRTYKHPNSRIIEFLYLIPRVNIALMFKSTCSKKAEVHSPVCSSASEKHRGNSATTYWPDSRHYGRSEWMIANHLPDAVVSRESVPNRQSNRLPVRICSTGKARMYNTGALLCGLPTFGSWHKVVGSPFTSAGSGSTRRSSCIPCAGGTNSSFH